MFRVPGGETIEVLRNTTARDRFGDVQRASAGLVHHVVFQWGSGGSSTRGSFSAGADFRESAEFRSVAFIPKDSPVQVVAKDRFTYRGNTYQVVGQVSWDSAHPMTGFDFGYYMIQVEMVD